MVSSNIRRHLRFFPDFLQFFVGWSSVKTFDLARRRIEGSPVGLFWLVGDIGRAIDAFASWEFAVLFERHAGSGHEGCLTRLGRRFPFTEW